MVRNEVRQQIGEAGVTGVLPLGGEEKMHDISVGKVVFDFKMVTLLGP